MIFIQDYINFPSDFDKFPEMRDLSAEEQQYINKNGVTAFLNETKYTNKTATITFNGIKQVISKVFLSSYHINWIVDMLKNLYNAVQGRFVHKGTYNSTSLYNTNNIVNYNNLDYLCLNDCKGVPVSNTSYWSRITGKDGINGIDGENSVFYYLSCPYQAITRTSSTVYIPSNITVTANCLNGTTLSNPNCYFKYYSKVFNSNEWILKGSVGATNTTTLNISEIVDSITEAIKIGMYDSNNELLDEKILNILDMSPYPKTGYGNPIFFAVCEDNRDMYDKTIVCPNLIKYCNAFTAIDSLIGTTIIIKFTKGLAGYGVLRITDESGNECNLSGYSLEKLIGGSNTNTLVMCVFDGRDWLGFNNMS